MMYGIALAIVIVVSASVLLWQFWRGDLLEQPHERNTDA